LPGYFSPDYTKTLSEFGDPVVLPASGACLLRREIGTSGYFDAMGGYPVFCCPDWSGLREDLEAWSDRLVSVVVTPDPMSTPGANQLAAIFDLLRPYKDHFVIRTGKPPDSFVSRRHRLHAEKALRQVAVEVCHEPLRFVDEFDRLFGVLATRHRIEGLRRFSKQAFAKQFALPGFVMFRALIDGRIVGLDTWYLQQGCAQGHLSALDSTAYEMHAAYAIKWRVIEYFNDKAEWINLGGGRSLDGGDGLSAFKRGWATETRPSWICGRILQPKRYAALTRALPNNTETYFPSYRSGEFDTRASNSGT
jgi:hypothetical protein